MAVLIPTIAENPFKLIYEKTKKLPYLKNKAPSLPVCGIAQRARRIFKTKYAGKGRVGFSPDQKGQFVRYCVIS